MDGAIMPSSTTRLVMEDRETRIRRGQEAWQRHIHKGDATWNDWMAIGDALLIGREDAMAAAKTNQPIGSRYNSEFGRWLARHHFDNIDKSDRRHLIEVIENRPAIEAWRETLTQTVRLRLSHPSNVLRKWKAGTEGKEPKPRTLRDSIANLSEDNAKLKREVEELTARLREAEAAGGIQPDSNLATAIDTLTSATKGRLGGHALNDPEVRAATANIAARDIVKLAEWLADFAKSKRKLESKQRQQGEANAQRA
jgi:hypothetical protein